MGDQRGFFGSSRTNAFSAGALASLLLLSSCLEDTGRKVTSRGEQGPDCTRDEDCEAGEMCTGEGRCVMVPQPRCGDGQVTEGEECDLGEANSDAGACTTECKEARCGDGRVWLEHEECDDGNTSDEDPCKNGCVLNVCGDGVPGGVGETCDDGNQDEHDGCTSKCAAPTCGDGILQPERFEQCDDGNGSNNDDCVSCFPARCGDAYVWYGHEECDEGNDNADDAPCTSACLHNVCGDGLILAGEEECDDGGTCGDSPPTLCQRDEQCLGRGDGVCQPKGGDGCNTSCKVESRRCCIPGNDPYCISEGTVNPLNPCAICNPDQHKTAWSPNDGVACNDGNTCTVYDTCANMQCVSSSSLYCADGNPCTDDSCDPVIGCVHTPRSGYCKDVRFCNGVEQCHDGQCISPGSACGGPLPYCIEATDSCVACLLDEHCDDGSPCTLDTCSADNTCVHSPTADGAACDDGKQCTTTDRCSAGACVGNNICPGGFACLGTTCACSRDSDCGTQCYYLGGTPDCISGRCYCQ